MKADPLKNIKYRTPEELKELTGNRRRETLALLKQLKKMKPGKLDDVAHELHARAFRHFDCLDCANCCKTIGPRLTTKDIERLARHLKMKTSLFMTRYVRMDEDGDYIFNARPCPFLQPDNFCLVYEKRPRACREYPHTDRKNFYQILGLSHKNCATCPVVFEIFEVLEKMVNAF